MGKLYKTKENIEKYLKKYGIKNYIIREDGSVDVDGDVKIHRKNIKALKVQFGVVSGEFSISKCPLKNLIGFPKEVGSLCIASAFTLESVKGCPKSQHIQITACGVKSLEGIPEGVKTLVVNHNFLTTLYGLPKTVEKLECNCNEIRHLKHLHKGVKMLYAYGNNLKTVEGMPDGMETIDVHWNKLEDLSHLKPVKNMNLQLNDITKLKGVSVVALEAFKCDKELFTQPEYQAWALKKKVLDSQNQ